MTIGKSRKVGTRLLPDGINSVVVYEARPIGKGVEIVKCNACGRTISPGELFSRFNPTKIGKGAQSRPICRTCRPFREAW